jgi:hypothetical protein
MVIWPTHKVKAATRKQRKTAARKQARRMTKMMKGRANG